MNGLNRLIGHFKDDAIGAAAPRLLNFDGSLQPSVYRYPTLKSIRNYFALIKSAAHQDLLTEKLFDYYHGIHEIEAARGAALLIRKSLYEELNGLDENYFFYGEEIDFCYRLTQSGKKILFDGTHELQHKGSGSSSKLDPARFHNRFKGINYFFHKHYGDKIAAKMRRSVLAAVKLRIIIYKLLSIKPDIVKAYQAIVDEFAK